MEKINEKEAKQELEKGMQVAEKVLKDEDKMEKFLQKVEDKLKVVPLAGDTLSMLPTLVSLIKSYIQKEYTAVHMGTILAVISALIYWLLSIDLIPDAIPVAGYIDDAAIVAACLNLVGSDIEEYRKWRGNATKE